MIECWKVILTKKLTFTPKITSSPPSQTYNLRRWPTSRCGPTKMLFAPDTVPFIASLTAVLLSATVGLVLRFRNGAKPARRTNLFKEEGTPAAPDAAEDEEHDVLLADEPEGGSCTTKPEQRGDYPLLGSRVEFHGLQKAAPLNGTYGVVLRESAGRFAVRKEVAHADDAASVMVRASNLRAAPPLDSLAAVQRLVDAAPTGARVTLPCTHSSDDATFDLCDLDGGIGNSPERGIGELRTHVELHGVAAALQDGRPGASIREK